MGAALGLLGTLGLSLLSAVPAMARGGVPWVLVDTRTETVYVMEGPAQDHHVLAQYDDVSLGRGGVGKTHLRGDGKTPLGTFHIAWIDRDSRFRIFYGLDFPNMAEADRAYGKHLIDRKVYDEIIASLAAHRIPPQDTPLGGQIGIHGLGAGSLLIHQAYNWTEGCVALTNGQIASLSKWVGIGTKVVIR
ncbi:MAG: L,D-transpeptidase [Betaproteobacteria bacterium]|nr:L,D-transpeptidase [Betaproteobacteria bacterium]